MLYLGNYMLQDLAFSRKLWVKKSQDNLDMVAHIQNPSAEEAEAREPPEFKVSLVYKGVSGQPGLHNDF